MIKILTILILLLTVPSLSFAEDFKIPQECEILIDDFTHGIKAEWQIICKGNQ